MGFTHLYSFPESSNPSELAFAASRTEYSLAASTTEMKTPLTLKNRLNVNAN
jgi:hypothetical protein